MVAASLAQFCKLKSYCLISSKLNNNSGGLLGDCMGRLNFLWPMVMFTGCICIFVWLLVNSLAAIVLFACLYGFGTGNFTALLPSVIGQITPDESLGARVGAFYSIVAIASLIGTPIGSVLITDNDNREGYRWLIIFSVRLSNKNLSSGLTGTRGLQSLLVHCSCWEAESCMTEIFERSGEYLGGMRCDLLASVLSQSPAFCRH